MKHKTAELEGALLDAAVAKALGAPRREFDAQHWVEFVGDKPVWCTSIPNASTYLTHPFTPSTDWSYGGPIIERERIGTWSGVDPYTGRSSATLWFAEGPGTSADRVKATGSTPLIAAMRAFVASRFGEEVEL